MRRLAVYARATFTPTPPPPPRMFNIFNLDALHTRARVVAVTKCARFALNNSYEVPFFQDIIGRCRKYHLGAGDDVIDDRYWIAATDALSGIMVGFFSGTLGTEHDSSVDMVCLLAGMDATDVVWMLMRGFERSQAGNGSTMTIYRAGPNLEMYRALVGDGYMPFNWRKGDSDLEKRVTDAITKVYKDAITVDSMLDWLSNLVGDMWQEAMKPESTMKTLGAKFPMLFNEGKANPMWVLVKPVSVTDQPL